MNTAPLSFRSFLSSSLAFGLLSACASAPSAPPRAVPEVPDGPPALLAKEESPRALRVVPGANVRASGSFLPPLSLAITSFGAASSERELFLVGGYSGTPHAYSKEGQSKEILISDAAAPSGWSKLAELDRGLQGLAAVFHEGKLCHFGGSHASNEAGSPTIMTSVTTARCLDTSARTWSELPELPSGRSSHEGALIGSTVYLAGGWTLSGDATQGSFVGELLALDLKRPEAGWRTIEAPFKRRAVGVGVSGTKLVIVGGMTDQGRPVGEVDIYDTKTNTWSKGPDFPGDAFGIAVTEQGKRIVASGREGILRSFLPGESAWRDERRLAYGRFFHQLLPLGSDIVALGGIGGMHTRGRTRPIEKISLKPGVSYGQMTLDYPGLAKNRQGILTHGEEIYLFGGNRSLEQHDFERQHFTDEGWIFDLATLDFRETTPFPFRRQTIQTVTTERGGIALGGFGHEPLEGASTQAISHAEGFIFDAEKATWSPRAGLSRGRTQFGLVSHQDTLWIFGGLNYDPTREGGAAFDHDTSIWTAQANDPKSEFGVSDVTLPGPRRAFAAAVLDGKYYIVGGMKEDFQLVEDCLEFDFEKKSFSQLPCPAARLSGDLIPAGGKLYLVGGSVRGKEGIEESRRVDVYDPKTRKWSDLGFELPLSTRHLRALPYREQILLLTTHSDKPEITIGILNPGAL